MRNCLPLKNKVLILIIFAFQTMAQEKYLPPVKLFNQFKCSDSQVLEKEFKKKFQKIKGDMLDKQCHHYEKFYFTKYNKLTRNQASRQFAQWKDRNNCENYQSNGDEVKILLSCLQDRIISVAIIYRNYLSKQRFLGEILFPYGVVVKEKKLSRRRDNQEAYLLFGPVDGYVPLARIKDKLNNKRTRKIEQHLYFISESIYSEL